jgi:hypothetical protein
MPTLLPQDSDNNPIPAMRFRSGGAHSITVTSSSARNSTAFNEDTRVISVCTDIAMYVKFGTSSVTATSSDHYLPAGIYYDIAVGGGRSGHYTHVAALRAGGADGVLKISEKE